MLESLTIPLIFILSLVNYKTLVWKIHAMICLHDGWELVAQTQNLFVYIFPVVKHRQFCKAFYRLIVKFDDVDDYRL